MDHRPGRALLLARAGLLAAVALVTGAAAHVSADGRLPGAVGLALIAGLTLVVAARLLARPASALRVVLLTVGAQTGIHVLLTATAGHAGDHAASGTGHASGHAAGHAAGHAGTSGPGAALGRAAAEIGTRPLPVDASGRRVGSLVDHAVATPGAGGEHLALPAPLVHVLADLTGAHAPMMVLHLLAAAAVGLWLAAGERALWTLVSLAVRVLVPEVPAVATAGPPGRPHPAVLARPRPRPGVLLARVADRRGPPTLLAA